MIPPLAGSSPDWPAPNEKGHLLEVREMVLAAAGGRRAHRVWVAPWCAQLLPREKSGWQRTSGVCPMCGCDVRASRTWCGRYCSDLAAICSNPRAARTFVWGRDGGRCALAEEGCWPLSRHGLGMWRHRPDDGRYDGAAFTPEDRAERVTRVYEGPRLDDSWQVDHIVELVDGGSHWPGNMQILCTYHHRVKTQLATATRRAA